MKKFLKKYIKMEKASLLSVIIYGLCVVIWSVKAVWDVYEVTHGIGFHSTALVVGDALCALIWTAAFIVQIIRYRIKDEDEEKSITREK